MTEQRCKTCNTKLVVKERMFHWRGKDFSGLVCEPCNALYDNPEDSFEDYVKTFDQRMMHKCIQCGGPLSKNRKKICSNRCAFRYAAANRKSRDCPKCDRKISVNNFERHVKSCSNNEDVTPFDCLKQKKDKYECPFCYKLFKKGGILAHIWRKHTKAGQDLKSGPKVAWNKGLTKDTDMRVRKSGETTKLGYSSGRLKAYNKGKKHKPETISLLKELAKTREFKTHFSRKSYPYTCTDGSTINLQSSFEVKVAQSLDQNNVHWERPKPLTWTDEKGKKRKYYADFYLPGLDVYLDPKNDYLIKVDAFKIAQVEKENQVCVIILNSEQLYWDAIVKIS